MRLIIKKGIFLIIVLQLVIISYLFVKLYKKINISSTGLQKIDKGGNVKGIETRTDVSNLKHFYELQSESDIIDRRDWLPAIPVYTINKDNLNDRYNYSVEKPKDTFRIVTLGDSFTFGALVDTKYNWTEVLEDKLNNDMSCKKYKKIEVINLGVFGYDIEYEVERFRIRGQKYDPDLILWMLVDNKRILERLLPLKLECIKQFREQFSNLELEYMCWEKAFKQYTAGLGSKKINDIIVDKFNGIFKLYDSQIVAIDLDGEHSKVLKMIEYPKKTHVFDIDFWGKEDLQLPDNHPNIEGHRYFADNIYDYLLNNKIIPCQ